VSVSAGSSKDSGSGVSGYQSRVSTDGGATWSIAVAGKLVTVSAEGQRLVQFRTRDRAGNVSAWTTGGAGGTVRIDRTAPSDPAVAGGSLEWQNSVSVPVSAAGATDTGGSGLKTYQYRTSTDGGLSWSAPLPGASADVTGEGETLVEFQALDEAGNVSDWTPVVAGDANTVRIDRSLPTTPTVTGDSSTWQSVASVTLTAGGSVDGTGGSGIDHYEHRESTDGGVTWSAPAVGMSDAISAEGQTLVGFRAVDTATLASAWKQATVRIDRTAPSDPVTGGALAGWQSVPSEIPSASGSTDSGSGVDHYQYRESTDGGSTWSTPVTGATDTVSAAGQTLVAFQAVDGAGNTSAWIAQTVSIDRTAPSAPASVSGGSASWQNTVSVTISASGAGDTGGSGLAGYEYRTSTDGGGTWSTPSSGADATVSDDGETLVQFRAVDAAGNVSAWTPTPTGATDTVRIDRTGPSDPSATGGSLTWTNAPSVTVTGGGSIDAQSGIAGYQYRTSTNAGGTWSAPTSGTNATISGSGETLVEFRAIDNAGNVSTWAPTPGTAGATVRLDHTAPTAPSVAGGSPTWLSQASLTFTASASTDTGGSGLAGYQHRTSTDNGITWASPVAGPSTMVTSQGQTLVQFRALDGAGNASTWAPATNPARLDRTPPTLPTVSGGSTACKKVVNISASGSTDPLSGINRYEYRYSTSGGTTWTTPVSGTHVQFKTKGTYIVKFRVLDNATNATAWAPSSNTAASTACIK
jgi:hypothetical protein